MTSKLHDGSQKHPGEILIADDNHVFRSAIHEILEQHFDLGLRRGS
jgi:PleD family two-component response regulator